MNSAMKSYLSYNGYLLRRKRRPHYHSILPWLTWPDDTGWDTNTFQTRIPPCSPAWASLRFAEAFSSSHFLCPIGPSPQKRPICSAMKFRFLESARSAQVGCGGVCLPDAPLHLSRDPLLKRVLSLKIPQLHELEHLIYCLPWHRHEPWPCLPLHVTCLPLTRAFRWRLLMIFHWAQHRAWAHALHVFFRLSARRSLTSTASFKFLHHF